MKTNNNTMIIRSIKVNRNDIGYLKWLLESHDGMATPTTRNGFPDIVDLLIAPDFKEEMDSFIAAIKTEISAEDVPAPTESPL